MIPLKVDGHYMGIVSDCVLLLGYKTGDQY